MRDQSSAEVVLRDGVILAFFLEPFVHQCSDALSAAFDKFTGMAPKKSLKWAVVSATSEEWRPYDAKAEKRIRDSLAPSGASKRRFTAFRVNDFGDEAPQYGFTLSDRDKEDEHGLSRTLVQMTFPPSVVQEGSAGLFVRVVEEFTSLLNPAYGYCSLGLLPSDARQTAAFAEMRAFAKRFPGYDVSVNDLAQLDIGSRTRGAKWITVLGPDLAERLGGLEALREHLPSEVSVSRAGNSIVVRAGTAPELGDVNKKVPTPLLRAVALVLEPVTLFGEVNLRSYFANFDDEFLRRWERRFLD